MKQLSNAQFQDWDKNPILFGTFVEPSLRLQDQDPKDGTGKKGDINGFVFIDENGDSVVAGNSKAVVDALAKCNAGTGVQPGNVVGFKFQKTVKLKGGKNFRVFAVHEFDSMEEAAEFYSPVK